MAAFEALYLASRSPRRLELLQMLGYRVHILLPKVDEHSVTAETPKELAAKLSRLKADAALPLITDPSLPLVASDTIVELDGKTLGKPKDPPDAVSMLRSLSGKTHFVHTGITVLHGGKAVTDSVSAAVCFRNLSDGEIRRYVASGDPMDKAGAYGIQCFAGSFVREIHGDYYAIVGLPICRLTEILNDL